MFWGLRDICTRNIDVLTAPDDGTGTEGSQSVVYLDQPQASDLWFAFNTGEVGGGAARHPPEAALSAVPT